MIAAHEARVCRRELLTPPNALKMPLAGVLDCTGSAVFLQAPITDLPRAANPRRASPRSNRDSRLNSSERSIHRRSRRRFSGWMSCSTSATWRSASADVFAAHQAGPWRRGEESRDDERRGFHDELLIRGLGCRSSQHCHLQRFQVARQYCSDAHARRCRRIHHLLLHLPYQPGATPSGTSPFAN